MRSVLLVHYSRVQSYNTCRECVLDAGAGGSGGQEETAARDGGCIEGDAAFLLRL